MGDLTFSRHAYTETRRARGIEADSYVTRAAEQEAKDTGRLKPSVDPSNDVIRRSLLRFNPVDGHWVVAVGCPMDIESICDTTGSMGGNVDIAMKALPDTYELCSQMLPGYDLQLALGIFGDVGDYFPFQRPQFEMSAEKIVDYLKDMVPERKGGDNPEDPHYGLFAAAYLTSSYTNRIGLKGYHFTVSDAPAHDRLFRDQLQRIFGANVFEKAAENGHEIDRDDLPSNLELVRDLLKRAHAFFLQVNDSSSTRNYWTPIFGAERIITPPDTEYLPHVEATIIGLTEGTLQLSEVEDFLTRNNVDKPSATSILRSVSNIPLGAGATLRSKLDHDLPNVGDIFINKTDLWPTSTAMSIASEVTGTDGIRWL